MLQRYFKEASWLFGPYILSNYSLSKVFQTAINCSKSNESIVLLVERRFVYLTQIHFLPPPPPPPLTATDFIVFMNWSFLKLPFFSRTFLRVSTKQSRQPSKNQTLNGLLDLKFYNFLTLWYSVLDDSASEDVVKYLMANIS